MLNDYLTTGDIARRTGLPVWLVRRRADQLGDLPRIGPYRVVPFDRLPELEKLLGRKVVDR